MVCFYSCRCIDLICLHIWKRIQSVTPKGSFNCLRDLTETSRNLFKYHSAPSPRTPGTSSRTPGSSSRTLSQCCTHHETDESQRDVAVVTVVSEPITAESRTQDAAEDKEAGPADHDEGEGEGEEEEDVSCAVCQCLQHAADLGSGLLFQTGKRKQSRVKDRKSQCVSTLTFHTHTPVFYVVV